MFSTFHEGTNVANIFTAIASYIASEGRNPEAQVYWIASGKAPSQRRKHEFFNCPLISLLFTSTHLILLLHHLDHKREVHSVHEPQGRLTPIQM